LHGERSPSSLYFHRDVEVEFLVVKENVQLTGKGVGASRVPIDEPRIPFGKNLLWLVFDYCIKDVLLKAESSSGDSEFGFWNVASGGSLS
jgi:hypothetical protein